MEKLYCVYYEFVVKGSYKTKILHREIPVKATVETFCDRFVVSKKEDISKKVKELVKEKIEEYKTKIEKYGYIYLVDLETPFFSENRFEKIDDFEIDFVNSREATIKECLKNLTPDEYNRLYGDTLTIRYGKKGEIND